MNNDDPIRAVMNGLATRLPFTFTYDGTPSADLMAAWPRMETCQHRDGHRTQRAITWTDPASALQVRFVVVEYHDSRTIEWTVTFKNAGAADTPVIGDVLALDLSIEMGTLVYSLHTNNGSDAQAKDFGPHVFQLPPDQRYLFYSVGGRPTNGYVIGATDCAVVQGGGWPFYNIDAGTRGLILAIGWPGQWVCQMTRDESARVHLQAGMSSQTESGYTPDSTLADACLLKTILRAGESVRTPLIVLQSWSGDWITAQNIWRRWMLAYNTPQVLDDTASDTVTPAYRVPVPLCTTGSVDYYAGGVEDWTVNRLGWYEDAESDEISWMIGPDGYVAHGTTPQPDGTTLRGDTLGYWVMDAGWNTTNGTDGWMSSVGNWTPDPTRFPRGLKPISDLAHAHNMTYVLWYEPERAVQGTAAYGQRFFLEHAQAHQGGASLKDKLKQKLLNWGDPAGLSWAIETFDASIISNGVDVFRQDFNMDPIAYWNANDAMNRQGYTQAKWVEGLLSFWDTLRRRHPTLLIDLCASGGRRLDLESLRRGIPLLRSDYTFEPMGQQGHTHGLAFWLPYYGTGAGPLLTNGASFGSSIYVMRSCFCPWYSTSVDIRLATEDDWNTMKRMTAEWWQIALYMLGDYYPLLPYDCVNQDVWLAWQFDRPETGEGMVQAFRRLTNSTRSMTFPLRGLDATAQYSIYDFDTAATTVYSGTTLITAGLAVTLGSAGSACTYTYTKLATS